MSDTPKVNNLLAGIAARRALRGFSMPEDRSDITDLARKLERHARAMAYKARLYAAGHSNACYCETCVILSEWDAFLEGKS